MRIYAGGGAGCNITASLMKAFEKGSPSFAEIKPVYIDTSKSNLSPDIPASQLYLVDGRDGAGKVRDDSYSPFADCYLDVLLKHKPCDVNVVLAGISGGSGSVIGPVLVSELLARGETVIVIGICSTASGKETENSLKTLQSYEKIASTRNTPVILAYRENSAKTPRGQVDAEVQMLVATLAVMFSGNNRELDSADLRNFLVYDRVTDFKPKLSHLDIFSGNISLPKGQAVVSLVTLTDDTVKEQAEIFCEYQAVGYVPESAKSALGIPLPIHAAVVSGYFNGIADALQAKLTTYSEVRRAVSERSIAGDDVHATKDGIVL